MSYAVPNFNNHVQNARLQLSSGYESAKTGLHQKCDQAYNLVSEKSVELAGKVHELATQAFAHPPLVCAATFAFSYSPLFAAGFAARLVTPDSLVDTLKEELPHLENYAKDSVFLYGSFKIAQKVYRSTSNFFSKLCKNNHVASRPPGRITGFVSNSVSKTMSAIAGITLADEFTKNLKMDNYNTDWATFSRVALAAGTLINPAVAITMFVIGQQASAHQG